MANPEQVILIQNQLRELENDLTQLRGYLDIINQRYQELEIQAEYSPHLHGEILDLREQAINLIDNISTQKQQITKIQDELRQAQGKPDPFEQILTYNLRRAGIEPRHSNDQSYVSEAPRSSLVLSHRTPSSNTLLADVAMNPSTLFDQTTRSPVLNQHHEYRARGHLSPLLSPMLNTRLRLTSPFLDVEVNSPPKTDNDRKLPSP